MRSRRILSLIMIFALLLTSLPCAAFADNPAESFTDGAVSETVVSEDEPPVAEEDSPSDEEPAHLEMKNVPDTEAGTAEDEILLEIASPSEASEPAEQPSESESIESANIENGDIESENTEAVPASVEPAVEEPVTVSLNMSSASIGVKDGSLKLSVLFSDGSGTEADGTARAVTFKTSSKSTAKVDTSGKVTGVAAGKAVITAVTQYGSASCNVSVYKAPAKIKAKLSSNSVDVGETGRISPVFEKGCGGTCTYASSDTSVMTVDGSGNFNAVGKGKAVLTVRTYNGKTASAAVTVYALPSAISFSETEKLTGVGLSFASKMIPGGDHERDTYTFVSSNTDVATVSENGIVTAVGAGSAVITATGTLGCTCDMTVTVLPAPDSVSFSKSGISVGLKENRGIASLLVYPEGAFRSVSYKSSKPSVAAVNGNGVITPKTTGTAVIRATAYNGKAADIKITVYKRPSRVKAKLSTSAVDIGLTGHIQPVFDKGFGGGCTYVSSDNAVLTVDGDGVFTGIGKGKAKLTVRTYNGKTASSWVTVYALPETISFSETEKLTGVGLSFASKVVPGGDYERDTYTFASSDTGVATVSENGTVTAVGTGTAVITATGTLGCTCDMTVTVLPAPGSVAFEKTSLNIGLKEKPNISGLVIYPEDAFGTVSYTSSKKAVATVNANGVVTPKKTGTAVIRARAYNGKYADLKINVCKTPQKIKASVSPSGIMIGGTASAKPVFDKGCGGSCTYSSSDTSVFTVDENGVCTGIGKGKAKVNVRTYNGKTASAWLTVYALPETISFTETEKLTGAGLSFAVKVVPGGDYERDTYTFASSDTGVATVSENGTVTAVGAGTAVITATGTLGCTCDMTVTVLPAPESVSFTAPSRSMGLKEKYDLTNMFVYPEDAYRSVKFTSSKSSVASVNAAGVVTAKAAGTATIRAKAYNGRYADVKITVSKAPKKVKASASASWTMIGSTGTVKPVFEKGFGGGCTYASSDTSVLTVDNNGIFTGTGKGTAKVNVRTYNGKTASVNITVYALPASISFPVSEAVTGAGLTIRASAQPDGEYERDTFVYTSLDPDIASVSNDGTVTALRSGTAVIRATGTLGCTCDMAVTVMPAPESVSLPETYELLIGKTLVLAPEYAPSDAWRACTYTSSNPKAAKVSADGTITAVSKGTSRITLTTYNNRSAAIDITVPGAPTYVKLNSNYLSMASGETFALVYTIDPGAKTEISYTSSNPGVASVDAGGNVTAVSKGTAIITAAASNGKKTVCIVNVDITETEGYRPVLSDGREDLSVTYMDIGRNDGILICCDGEYAFIDSGMRGYGINAVKYMKSLGVTHLKYYICSHAHKDHIGGGPYIISQIPTDVVIAPHSTCITQLRKFSETSAEKAVTASIPYRIMTRGDKLMIGGTTIDCLGPVKYTKTEPGSLQENSNSLVLMLTYGEKKFLMTGDATESELNAINKASPGILKTDVFKNPHHNGALSAKALKMIQSVITVISTSYNCLPSVNYLNLLKTAKSQVYVTSSNRNSHVTVSTNGSVLKVVTVK